MINKNKVSVWKEWHDEICYYKANLNHLFDYEVLDNLVFFDFMNNKDLYEKTNNWVYGENEEF